MTEELKTPREWFELLKEEIPQPLKPQELRIGNYYDQFGNIHQANGQVIKDLENAPASQLWCKPIPLTEEWHSKLGGIPLPENDGVYYSFPEIDSEIHFEYYEIGTVCVIYSSTGAVVPIEIEFVHTFQNLVHALTGQELTIKQETNP